MSVKNPLNRRILRELRTDMGKYIVIFLFMIITIGFVSGDLVASDSMLQALGDSYEQYNVEDGHFRLQHEADDELLSRIEQEKVTIYKDYYTDISYHTADGAEKTIRIFRDRSRFNQACIMEGVLPQKKGEIAIDRMYADNNGLAVGDTLTLEGKEYSISGLVALSDYSTMFESTSDTMFDALNFSVALVTISDFDDFRKGAIAYNYAWRYNDGSPVDETVEKNQADDLSEAIVKAILKEEGGSEVAMALGILTLSNEIEEFTPRYANQAIQFTRDDIGGDRNMMLAFLYILIAIMAFIFGVTISHTITKESTVIGTLRASGYTRAELFRQYIAMPVLVTLLSALVGNILGYSVFKYMMVYMYYNSYSLPSYVTIWNASAFVQTTLIPVMLMLFITSVTLIRKLKLSPLRFIRRDLSRKKQQKATRLPRLRFFNRFRLRIILQNKSSYLTLFFGILISITLLLFGFLLPPLLENVADTAVASMAADYQYFLKEETGTDNASAEKFAAETMQTYANGYKGEEVTLYGIQENSRYIKETMPEQGVLISSGYASKYQLQQGEVFLIKKPFDNTLFELTVSGIYDAPTTIGIYMAYDDYCELFDVEEDYYSGYFSNEELTDLNPDKIYSCLTAKDMTKFSDQMTHSMGQMFRLFYIFATILFVLVIYLLTKIILERNATSISMVKILGYTDSEIGRLYLIATSWVMILSVLVSFGVVTILLEKLFVLVMKDYSGWVPFSMDGIIYVKAFVLTIVSYLAVAFMQMRRIRKIPMDEALKNVE